MMPLVKLIAIYLGRWLRPIMVKRFLTSGGLRNVNFYFTQSYGSDAGLV